MSRWEELASTYAWRAAAPARQEKVAREVAEATGWSFEALRAFADPSLPVASLLRPECGRRFLLVPGGSYTMGLSDRELEAIRAASAPHQGEGNFYEEWTSLLVRPDPMRPLHTEQIPPLLVLQGAFPDIPAEDWSEPLHELLGEEEPAQQPPDLDAWLGSLGLRLPWEREWEWLARGGREGECTYLGPKVPGVAHLRQVSRALDAWLEDALPGRGEGQTNDFGLLGFGPHPELCREAWRPTYEGSPEPGTELRERTVRGGAVLIYPWQACGEWQLLLSALRLPARNFDFSLAVRLVRDLP